MPGRGHFGTPLTAASDDHARRVARKAGERGARAWETVALMGSCVGQGSGLVNIEGLGGRHEDGPRSLLEA